MTRLAGGNIRHSKHVPGMFRRETRISSLSRSTVYQAVDLGNSLPIVLLWGHLRLGILTKKVLRAGFAAILFLANHRARSLSCSIYVSTGLRIVTSCVEGIPVETESENAFPKLRTLPSTSAQCQSRPLSTV